MKKTTIALLVLLCAATTACDRTGGTHFTPAASPEIRFTGRAVTGEDGSLTFDWSGSHFTFRFEGRRCAMRLSDTGCDYYNVFVDGRQTAVVTATGADTTIVLADSLPKGIHTLLVQKRTEGEQGRTTLYGIESDAPLLAAPEAPARHIEFIGDSHTCGYGTEGLSAEEQFTPQTENCDLAWGCIVARYFGAEYTLIAHSGQGIVRNWGDEKEVSDCTMRERMRRTLDMEESPAWDGSAYRPDIVVIKLGSNDFSTGIAPAEKPFNDSYARAIDYLRSIWGQVPILCVAPSDNTVVLRYLEQLIAERQDANLHFTVILPGATNWDSDMGANYHPNHHGHRKLAMSVIPYIATITGWELPDTSVE